MDSLDAATLDAIRRESDARLRAEQVVDAVIAWMQAPASYGPKFREQVLNDLARAMDRETDGVRIACRLARDGWDGCDARLVEILEGM